MLNWFWARSNQSDPRMVTKHRMFIVNNDDVIMTYAANVIHYRISLNVSNLTAPERNRFAERGWGWCKHEKKKEWRLLSFLKAERSCYFVHH